MRKRENIKSHPWGLGTSILTIYQHNLVNTYTLPPMWVVDVFPFIIFPFLSTLSMASALRCFFDADFLELQVYVMMTPNSTVNSSSPIHPPTIQWTSVVFICFNIELVVVDDPSADLTTMG